MRGASERSPRRPQQLEEIKGEHVQLQYHTDIPAYGEEIEGADFYRDILQRYLSVYTLLSVFSRANDLYAGTRLESQR